MLLKIGENLKAKAKLECYEKLSEKSLFTFVFYFSIYLFIHSFRDSFICLIIYLFIYLFKKFNPPRKFTV